jgi:catechol 2,3-dioxygenase-like lactoylglutathione lyase family enzyme
MRLAAQPGMKTDCVGALAVSCTRASSMPIGPRGDPLKGAEPSIPPDSASHTPRNVVMTARELREVSMASTEVSSNPSAEMQDARTVDMKLEVVTLPVSEVDRAKDFYQSLGWRLDADIQAGDNFRVVQLTPPHSGCSVAFGTGVTTGEPGSVHRLILAVSDIDAARAAIASRGVEVSDVFHLAGGRVPGRDPQNRSYQTYAAFSDPDGNEWLLQEIKTRLPGREWQD